MILLFYQIKIKMFLTESLSPHHHQTLRVLTDGRHTAPEDHLADQEEERHGQPQQAGLHLALVPEGAADHTARVDQLGLTRTVVQTEGVLVAGGEEGGGAPTSPPPLDHLLGGQAEETEGYAEVDIVRPAQNRGLGAAGWLGTRSCRSAGRGWS